VTLQIKPNAIVFFIASSMNPTSSSQIDEERTAQVNAADFSFQQCQTGTKGFSEIRVSA
jgi:hypothetical protein